LIAIFPFPVAAEVTRPEIRYLRVVTSADTVMMPPTFGNDWFGVGLRTKLVNVGFVFNRDNPCSSARRKKRRIKDELGINVLYH
jgi:hypothetical protein